MANFANGVYPKSKKSANQAGKRRTEVAGGPFCYRRLDARRWLSADKALLRYLSFLLKPVFAMNHRWAMAQGEKSLRVERIFHL